MGSGNLTIYSVTFVDTHCLPGTVLGTGSLFSADCLRKGDQSDGEQDP